MKRSLFDSEYDRVRRDAGLARPRYERPEFPDEAAEAQAERVAAGLADFHARMAELKAAEQQHVVDVDRKHNERRAMIDERMRLREFTDLGLTPPEGSKCSLGLLLQIGWRVEQVGDKAILTRPNWISPKRESGE
jgi:hypothetical protein